MKIHETTYDNSCKVDTYMKTYTVVAHDPGTKNYGYAITQGRVKNGKFQVRFWENGKLYRTVLQLKDSTPMRESLQQYLEDISSIYKRCPHPVVTIAERYMTRGIRGTLVECVNVMLGALVTQIEPSSKLKLVAAVTWKREMERCGLDLKEMYRLARVSAHQIDASLMSLFILMRGLGVARRKLNQQKLIQQIEAASTEPLLNKRPVKKAKRKR